MHEGTVPTPSVETEPNRDECVVVCADQDRTRSTGRSPACRSLRMLAVPCACPHSSLLGATSGIAWVTMPCVSLFGKTSQNDLCHPPGAHIVTGSTGIQLETGADGKWLPNSRGIAN